MRNLSWNNLLIQTITDPATFVLFDADRNLIAEERPVVKWREFDLLLPTMEAFLEKNGTNTRELDSIVLVNGPASFTWGRIASLTVNSLAFANKTPVFAIDYFEYCKLGGGTFPMLLDANKEECILKRDAKTEMALVRKDTVPSGEYTGFIALPNFAGWEIRVQSCINTGLLVRSLDLAHPVERIETLYLKRPNITLSAKHNGLPGTSHQ